ncbi:MAG TPA: hypothetical protein DCZ43_06285 [candidate division Zixibacteria bacterium]|nr:hypothetical protein [candidate division Zixibacteria bacterium]
MILAILSLSCGAVHQFAPPTPLKHNGFQSNIVISYDFNHFTPIPSISMNFYLGLGKNYNFGFGYQPPLGVSHLTLLKYLKKDPNKYGMLNITVYDVFPTLGVVKPNMEIGGSYIIKDGIRYSLISGGLWVFLNGNDPNALWWGYFNPTYRPYKIRPYIRPFFKYNLFYNDFRFGIQNYIGLAKPILSNDLRKTHQARRPIIRYRDIDRIEFNQDKFDMIIIMKDRSTYKIVDTYPYDAWFPLPEDFQKLRLLAYNKAGSGNYYYVMSYDSMGTGGKYELHGFDILELNLENIKQAYSNQQDIIITIDNKEKDRAILRKVHWYINDWSIAIGSWTR